MQPLFAFNKQFVLLSAQAAGDALTALVPHIATAECRVISVQCEVPEFYKIQTSMVRCQSAQYLFGHLAMHH